MPRLALVTGASTGIGRACALHLAGRGFHVLAGVRDLADAPDGLEAIRLDVTSEADVAAAAERVGPSCTRWSTTRASRSAGRSRSSRADRDHELDRRPRGEPAVRSLRGVQVRARGGRRRPAPRERAARRAGGQRRARRDRDPDLGQGDGRGPPDHGRDDGGAAAALRRRDRLRDEGGRGDRPRRVAPEEVAAVVGEALTADRPRARYVVGREAKVRAIAARLLPDRVFDAVVARALR